MSTVKDLKDWMLFILTTESEVLMLLALRLSLKAGRMYVCLMSQSLNLHLFHTNIRSVDVSDVHYHRQKLFLSRYITQKVKFSHGTEKKSAGVNQNRKGIVLHSHSSQETSFGNSAMKQKNDPAEWGRPLWRGKKLQEPSLNKNTRVDYTAFITALRPEARALTEDGKATFSSDNCQAVSNNTT